MGLRVCGGLGWRVCGGWGLRVCGGSGWRVCGCEGWRVCGGWGWSVGSGWGLSSLLYTSLNPRDYAELRTHATARKIKCRLLLDKTLTMS